MLLGYARVSTDEQTTRMQLDALQVAGCEAYFLGTGVRCLRQASGLADLLGHVHKGDTLVVWRLDRLGRSLPHLIEIVQRLGGGGVGLRRSRTRQSSRVGSPSRSWSAVSRRWRKWTGRAPTGTGSG